MNMLKRGLEHPSSLLTPLYGKAVDTIDLVGFFLCAQSMHMLQGLCTLPHVPLLRFHSLLLLSGHLYTE